MFLIGSGKNNDNKDNQKGPKGLSNILVEFSNSKETKHQFTDEQGRFAFINVRPGHWTLKIYDDSLPSYHYLKKKVFQMELKPGEEKTITATVLPRHRQIQILETGQIGAK